MKHCILCGNAKNSVRIATNKKFHWDVMYCKKCKLAYNYEDDAIIKKAYKKYYQKEYWHTQTGKSNIYNQNLKSKSVMTGIKFLRTLGISPLIAITHYEMMKKYVPKERLGRFLEIGPGEGYSLRFFSKKYDVRSIEPDSINAKQINKYFGRKVCKSGDVETDSIEGTYDFIYMSHVFEHLVSPKKFLKKIHSHINNNGIIFIEVPNCESPTMMKSSLDNETHTYHYTLESLRLIFEKEGFEVLVCNVYKSITDNALISIFKSIFHIPNYEKTYSKSGMKLVLIAKKKNKGKKDI